jgi:hypothetical protein
LPSTFSALTVSSLALTFPFKALLRGRSVSCQQHSFWFTGTPVLTLLGIQPWVGFSTVSLSSLVSSRIVTSGCEKRQDGPGSPHSQEEHKLISSISPLLLWVRRSSSSSSVQPHPALAHWQTVEPQAISFAWHLGMIISYLWSSVECLLGLFLGGSQNGPIVMFGQ